MNVAYEALVIGVFAAVVGPLLARLAPAAHPVSIYFAVGFLLHVASEIAGLNAWYCRNGSACSS